MWNMFGSGVHYRKSTCKQRQEDTEPISVLSILPFNLFWFLCARASKKEPRPKISICGIRVADLYCIREQNRNVCCCYSSSLLGKNVVKGFLCDKWLIYCLCLCGICCYCFFFGMCFILSSANSFHQTRFLFNSFHIHRHSTFDNVRFYSLIKSSRRQTQSKRKHIMLRWHR